MNIRKLYEGLPNYKVANGYHLEMEGCIVNVRQGLHDNEGRKVTQIEIIPDDRYAGEKKWIVDSYRNIRVIQTNEIV
jgi:hypothetical protein